MHERSDRQGEDRKSNRTSTCAFADGSLKRIINGKEGSIDQNKKWKNLAIVGFSFLIISNAQAFDPTGPAQLAELIQIVLDDVNRFKQLQAMVQNGQAQMDFLKQINAGLDSITGLLAALPVKDDQILGDIHDFQNAFNTVGSLYGTIPVSRDSQMELLHDQTIAESFRETNAIKDYADAQEKNANHALELSNDTSPKGAERLTAATSAQILHSLSQLLRVDGEMLKLQSEQLALNNHRDKDSVQHFNKMGADLTTKLGGFDGDFAIPQF
jgi:hypothetical protein